VVTLEFNKKNPRNASRPLVQQPCGSPNKTIPQNTKKVKWGSNGYKVVSHHIILCKGEKISVGDVVDLIK